MKFTSPARPHAAAMMRSPSFSRSSSSMITAILPARRSTRISSMVLNLLMSLTLLGSIVWLRDQPLEISRDHVNFDVRSGSDRKIAERRDLARVGNDVHIEAAPGHLIDRETDAIDANRSLWRH